MLATILNLIIPNRCVCGDILVEKNHDVCESCWRSIGLLSKNAICETCGDPFKYDGMRDTKCSECIYNPPIFDKARAVFKYNDVNGRMIMGLKYSDRTPYAKTLARFMSGKVKELGEDFDLIVSVPIHRKKLIQRKFNQSALLANKIAKLSGKKANNIILHKIKDIPPQASLFRTERLENAKGAYAVNPKYKNLIVNKKILLIDDVITTGATANECARVLKESGVANVYLITTARTILES
jgi:ComF family protein